MELFGMQNCAILSERRVNYTIRRERVRENIPVSREKKFLKKVCGIKLALSAR